MARRGAAWRDRDFETTLGAAGQCLARQCLAGHGKDLKQHKARLAAVGHGLVRLVAAGDYKAGIFRQHQTTAAQQQVRWRLAPAANDSAVVISTKERTMARSIHTRRKLGEAVQVMHEGAWFLGIVRQLWPPPRGEQWRYTIELDGGEMIVANAGDVQRQKHVRTSDPTLEEIWGPLTAAIRAEWPPETLLQRWQGPKTQPVQIQRIGRTSAAGRLESDE